MKILITCKKCPEVAINVDINGSYFGPDVECAKCGSKLLNAVVQCISVSPVQPFAWNTLQTGTAVVPPMASQTYATGPMTLGTAPNTTTFFWPNKFDVIDAEHAAACQCKDCKCKSA